MKIFSLPWRRDVACREVVELVTEYLEVTLSRRERARLRRHLRGCDYCARYLAQIRAAIRLTGRLRVEDVPVMPASVRAELVRAFRAAGG